LTDVPFPYLPSDTTGTAASSVSSWSLASPFASASSASLSLDVQLERNGFLADVLNPSFDSEQKKKVSCCGI
jgi:hypothetical protein